MFMGTMYNGLIVWKKSELSMGEPSTVWCMEVIHSGIWRSHTVVYGDHTQWYMEVIHSGI